MYYFGHICYQELLYLCLHMAKWSYIPFHLFQEGIIIIMTVVVYRPGGTTSVYVVYNVRKLHTYTAR